MPFETKVLECGLYVGDHVVPVSQVTEFIGDPFIRPEDAEGERIEPIRLNDGYSATFTCKNAVINEEALPKITGIPAWKFRKRTRVRKRLIRRMRDIYGWAWSKEIRANRTKNGEWEVVQDGDEGSAIRFILQ